MVDVAEDDRGRYPIATVSFWEEEPFTQNAQQFQSAPLLKVQNGGRAFSRVDHFEYRTMILAKSNRELKSFPFQHVGNFRDAPLPEDEIIFDNPWFSTLSRLANFDQECALIWRMDQYCAKGILLPFEWGSMPGKGDGMPLSGGITRAGLRKARLFWGSDGAAGGRGLYRRRRSDRSESAVSI